MRNPKGPESEAMQQVKWESATKRRTEKPDSWMRLTQAREAAKLSQAKLAEVCHMSPVTINLWEKGDAPSYVYNFLTMSRALGVSLDYLFYNDDFVRNLTPEDEKILKKAAEVLQKAYGQKK